MAWAAMPAASSAMSQPVTLNRWRIGNAKQTKIHQSTDTGAEQQARGAPPIIMEMPAVLPPDRATP